MKNNVVTGLSLNDVEEVSKIAKPGLSGWNSRVVYYNGSWMPYYEIGNPMLLKCAPQASTFTLTPASYEHTPLETTMTATTSITAVFPVTTKPTLTIPSQKTLSLESEHEKYSVSKETISPIARLATIFSIGALLSIIAWFIVRRVA